MKHTVKWAYVQVAARIGVVGARVGGWVGAVIGAIGAGAAGYYLATHRVFY